MNSINHNQVKCVITAMDIEFFAIIDCLQIERSQVHKIAQQYLIAESAEKGAVIAQAGIGALSAAACTKELYERYPCISSFISTGIAGALSDQLNVGDIVIGDSIIKEKDGKLDKIWSITEASEQKDEKGVKKGPILCSEEFISDAAIKEYFHLKYDALCVEMESAGIIQFANKHGIPFIAIKVISDHADKNALRSLIRMQKSVCNVLATYLLNQGVL